MHIVWTGQGEGPRWGYNDNHAAPTFTPSILIRSGHFIPGHKGPECWCTSAEGKEWGFKCAVCHSFVTDGKILFLGDCTHALAGKTVELPDLPDRMADEGARS